MAKKIDTTSFEPSLARLEEIVRLLEDGTLPLEQSLTLFEEGVGLSRRCVEVLADAERKVEVLTAARGSSVPFEALDQEAE